MEFKLERKHRLMATLIISFMFFVAEIIVAFMTKSLALLADSFHYLNDLIALVVALTATIISERSKSPQALSFGWQRARDLGAFFNGVFLVALGVSIFLQSIERFITIQRVEKPELVMIMGCGGFAMNVVSAVFLHEHHGHSHGHSHSHASSHDHGDGHSTSAIPSEEADGIELPLHHGHRHYTTPVKPPGRDLGMLGVLLHVLGDALNNVGVIIAAAVIWKWDAPAAAYADPAVSMAISLMILLTSIPLVRDAGSILLQSAPKGVVLGDVKHDLEQIPGIDSVHELHVWRLDQKKAIASAHVVVTDQSVSSFTEKANTIRECLHDYGIHSITLQPEILSTSPDPSLVGSTASSIRRRRPEVGTCQVVCGKGLCEKLTCCDRLPTPPR